MTIRFKIECHLDKVNSARREVTSVDKDVAVLLQQREDAVPYSTAGLEQHYPLRLKLCTAKKTKEKKTH